MGHDAFAQVIFSDVPLSVFGRTTVDSNVWTSTLIIPAYATALSAFLLLFHIFVTSNFLRNFLHKHFPSRFSEVQDDDSDELLGDASGFFSDVKHHIRHQGGTVIFTYKTIRFLSVLALLGLSIATFILEEEGVITTSGKRSKKHKSPTPDSNTHYLNTAEWLQVAVIFAYTYASLLAFFSITLRRRLNALVSRHLASVLLITWVVFAYRDIWPLGTFTLQPADIKEGWIIWAKVAILTLAAIVVPLFIPRVYVPVYPTDPKEPNPEQTASLASFVSWAFLDDIIFKAYRLPHLPYDMLPPLADYDQGKWLRERSFCHMDPSLPGKRKYLLWGILTTFSREYIIQAILISSKVIMGFASPVGINHLLRYLEQGGEGAVVRPWVWIIWLFLGPTLSSFCWQMYIFFSTRTLVRCESILTQLLFEHSLRIRMKADTGDSKSNTPSSSVATTPDTASIAESSTVNDDGETSTNDETVQGSSQSVTSSTTAKGKQKADKPNEAPAPKSIDSRNLVGKINNLVSSDLTNITEGRDFLIVFLVTPLQVLLCIVFLYSYLGWSSFVGMAVMLLLLPVPGWVASLLQTTQRQRMQKTDARVQVVTETMNVIRMIKLFGWEKKMDERIQEKRQEELKVLWKRQLLELANGNINFLIPIAIMIATFTTFTVIMKRELAASIVFSSMAVFEMMRSQLFMLFYFIPNIINAKVSVDRIDEFLKETELLDEFTPTVNDEAIESLVFALPQDEQKIGFNDSVFTWSNSSHSGTATPSKRRFTLRIDGELFFKQNSFNIIIGPTGSGKTSLLMALLGELHFAPTGPSSWYNLPRKGGVAYAAQESWVQNETIKDNILFGSPYDEVRYKKVLHQCALERDLTLFEAGDATEVGEKGLTLSGGQKARITLARAIYSSAEILLLDDVLAALDVHTAKWIVSKCFAGDLVKGRTILLVTHNVAMASKVADFVVSLGVDGRVHGQGTVSDAIADDEQLKEEVMADEEITEKADEIVDGDQNDEIAKAVDKKKSDGKLVVAEEIDQGHISASAIRLFTSAVGGSHPFLFWFICLGFIVVTESGNAFQVWFLGYWARQYETHDPSEVSVFYYISVYGIILVAMVIFYSISNAIFVWGALRAAAKIHAMLIEAILGTTLRWLDVTPTSRVITRCTQDIRAIDSPIPEGVRAMLEITISMLTQFGAVIVITPIFLWPGLVVAAMGAWVGQIYIKGQLSVKREMSNAKSPVIGHFGAAIAGLTSIRAYGAQEAFKQESLRRIDHYTRAGRIYYNLNRWICVRIDAFGSAFTAALAAYLIYGPSSIHSSNVGFSLNMAVNFTTQILWWVRILNQTEVSANSLERILQYIEIEQEPKNTSSGVPPAHWPSSGEVSVEKLSARYSPDGPEVLHSLSFHIKSGERVGVVGRTGSGKSSLTLSLLRCIFTEGTVYYDGIPTSNLNLDALRSNVTIIPQVPELLSGTLRQNLDPFEDYDDATLNDALRSAGLQSLQSDMADDDDGRITLDSAISSGGGNLSIGQRQILALARALVRQSKLLILDEATSAIDYKTDSIIQTSLRNELRDVTLLTIAHRLQTIMDSDKIMVLDAGKIVEFDSPAALLEVENGVFKSLVDESGDKDALYAVAQAKATGKD